MKLQEHSLKNTKFLSFQEKKKDNEQDSTV